MKRAYFGAVPLAVAGVFLAGSLLTGPAEAAKGKGTTVYNVKMTGEEEIDSKGQPNAGDLDGKGKIQIKINKAGDEICWKYAKVKKIDLPATAAHIHPGAAGVVDDPIVPLEPPDAKGKGKGCVDVDPEIVADIKEAPHNFYVNVHTTGPSGDFSAGAIRGQLEDAPAP